jgi:hypothetical protein
MKWSVLDQSPSSAGSTQDVAIRQSIALAQHCATREYWRAGFEKGLRLALESPEQAAAYPYSDGIRMSYWPKHSV